MSERVTHAHQSLEQLLDFIKDVIEYYPQWCEFHCLNRAVDG